MSEDTSQRAASTAQLLKQKDEIIQHILQEEDLYKILGAQRTCTPQELRRCYLERSKICHPDKLPFHPLSTSAFQRLGFAFDILRSPTTRKTYTTTSTPSPTSLPDKTTFLGGDHTFRSAILSLLTDLSSLLTGDIALIRPFLQSLHAQFPHLISSDVILSVENSFIRIKELVGSGRMYALLIYIELGRMERVRRRLMGCGWFDLVGRARLSVLLVRVVLAVPMRVDRKVREREEKVWRARRAGLQCCGDGGDGGNRGRGGILNERVYGVLEFIVGEEAGRDDCADEAWGVSG